MKIALLGATGNVGSHVLKEAVAAGHDVVAYARRPDAVAELPGVSVVEGALEDVDAMTAAIAGSDALIVSVTGPVKDKTFAQRTLPGIVKAAQDGGVGRLVYVSAFGAGDTADKAAGFARLIYRTVLKGFFDDKAKAEQILPSSGLNWTTVFPVNLKEAAALPSATIKPVSQIGKVPGLPTLPFANVAQALVDIAADSELAGERLVVTTPQGWKPAR